jgi:peptidoglycan/LPS O-acetylase OafA/YrhL
MDSLRAIAVVSVFLFHAFDNVDTAAAVTAQLKIGVTIFFVISGFLLYRPYVARHLEGSRGPRVRDFSRRRVLRILPAYWMALMLGALVLDLHGVFSSDAWVYFGFAQAYDTATVYNGIPIAWSLCVEVTFYALLPLYAAVAFRVGRRWSPVWRAEAALLLAVTATTIAARAVVEQHHGFTLFVWASLPGTFYWFALGMGMAVVSAALAGRTGTRARARVPTAASVTAWALALGGFAAVVLYEGAPDRTPFDPAHPRAFGVGHELVVFLAFGLIALLLVLPAVFEARSPSIVQRVLGMRLLGWFGLVSYGVFLWHKPLLDQIRIHYAHDSVLARSALAAVITAAIAAASYYVVERPLLRLKHLRGERR